MKRLFSLIIAVLLTAMPLFCSGCATRDDVIYLDVYNWEDYICIDDDANLIEDFEDYYLETYGKKVVVNYSTFGTNENMYNELQLSKVKLEDGSYDYGYDLVCPSDYMIQKMMLEGMLEEFIDIEEGNEGSLYDYNTYVSSYIYNLFDKNEWTNYACAYMYGTMGFVYNPEVLKASGYQEGDELYWDLPWKTYYKNLGTIKDSIRDTYALAIGYVYSDELMALKEQGLPDEEYSKKVEEIFNRTDEETVRKVTEALTVLKSNVYGFEVDSGKRDMASGKIAINFAWSGDAVYTLDLAEEAGTELYYTVPEEGSNIWFDGWVMPKGANVVVAQEFINFLSKPENARKNMNFIGYTPAIAGEDMVELCTEWYGAYTMIEVDEETYLSYKQDEYGVYFDEDNEKYYVELYLQEAIDEGLVSYADNGIDAETGYPKITVGEINYPVYDDEDEFIIGFETASEVECYLYDLTFLLSTREDVSLSTTYGVWTDTLGRQLTTQYPDEGTVTRCAIMKHFSEEEMKRLNDMWDEVKVMAMPTWLMWFIVIAILVVLVVYPVMSELNKRGVRINLKRKNKNLTLVKREII